MRHCHSRTTKGPNEICSLPSFCELTARFSVCLYSPADVLSKIPLFIVCLVVVGTGSYCPLNLARSAKHHLACLTPTRITRAIFWPGVQCDWYQTVFSPMVQFTNGHNFASFSTGAVVSRRLTTLGLEATPPSTVLGDSTGACWSFRGTAGTFGVVLDTPNVIPSHVSLHHRLLNSTTSLSCAPRQVTVWGMVDGDQNMKPYSSSPHVFISTLARVPPFSISKRGIFLPLADFDFDITSPSPHQTFRLFDEIRLWGIDFGVVVFDIRSNWGSDVTCLCSVYVYGKTAKIDT